MLGKNNNNMDRGQSTFWISVSEIKPKLVDGLRGSGAVGGVGGLQRTDHGDHLSDIKLRLGQVRTHTLSAIIHL